METIEFIKGDIVYLENGGEAFFVGEVDGKFVVNPFIYYGEEYENYREGNSVVVNTIYSNPPTEKLNKEIEDAYKKLSELKEECTEKRKEIRNTEKEYNNLVVKLKAFPALKRIEEFLEEKVTHFVVEEYDGTLSIKRIEEVVDIKSEYGRSMAEKRLLSLYGDCKGKDLYWGLSSYSDGSGRVTKVVPFVTEEEAKRYIYDELSKKMEEIIPLHLLNALIKNAEKFGVEVPDTVRKANKNYLIGNFNKNRDKLQEQIDDIDRAIAEL